ncbi:FAD/NAD(P)-binding protein [Cnuella takakiae]|nr:FAD/NAD(P)-binding protein [Cnuella takakiae]OLY94163.1 hypothetical protein BUE76_21440 [Cnuella takakiae]
MQSGHRTTKNIALIGGGPSALFLFKRLVTAGTKNIRITVFEQGAQVGAGMPYSTEGASEEHVTNVSDNEVPSIVTSIAEWLPTAPPELLERFGINPANFNEYKVLPRLLFGAYLSAQFLLLHNQALQSGLHTTLCRNTQVTDIIDDAGKQKTTVVTSRGSHTFDAVVICTGHKWPKHHEGKVPGWFDSPYPPAKLRLSLNEPVAIKGASLTAIDAVRTLARANGSFYDLPDGTIGYRLREESKAFRLVMHSLGGLLPALRVHLADPLLSPNLVLSPEEIATQMAANDGFIPLDYLFECNFKEPLREHDPQFYEQVKDLTLEAFVDRMMTMREDTDAFTLLKMEYAEAAASIRKQQPVFWKEALAMLSFALNYPAKYLSAEDMLRLKQVLMPLVSVVIAFAPQSAARELLALHEAGVLTLVPVNRDSKVSPRPGGGALYQYTSEDGSQQSAHYNLFVDCTGQPALPFEAFPFPSLIAEGVVSEALLPFRSAKEATAQKEEGNANVVLREGQWQLVVPGIAINDAFQVVDRQGKANPRIHIMAVPYIGGYNPDYSGLDFCETASGRIAASLLATAKELLAAESRVEEV